MIANSNCIAPVSKSQSPINLDEFLRVSQVAQEFNVHPMTVRRATNSGSLESARSNGGARLIKRRWAYEWLNIPVQKEERRKAVLCACRVSSRGQLNSLEEQEKLTVAYAREHYSEHEVIIKKRVQSGIILDSDEVLEILDLILNQEVEAIIINWEDRLVRTGFSLFQALCKRNNIKIHVLQAEPDRSLEEQLSLEILQFLTHYTNKVSGLKVRKLYGVDIDEEHLKEIYLAWRSGLSLQDLEKKFKHLKNQKGQSYSFTVIHRRLKANKESLDMLYGHLVTSNVEDFIKERVKYVRDEEEVTYKVLYGAYVSFVKSKGASHSGVLTKPKFSDELRRLGIYDRRKVNTKGATAFSGLRVNSAKV